MPIKVFISSTRDDLGEDLVKASKQAIVDAANNAVTVDMESWDTDFQPAVKVCRQKLVSSTHYLGLFAYRRGWVPDELKSSVTNLDHDQSITEYEFALADETNLPMAVFVPERGSFIAVQLEKRVEKQDKKERDEQEAFLKRIQDSGKALMPFSSEVFLYKKALQRAKAWSSGGIRNTHTNVRGTTLDFSQLGRRQQVKAFREIVEELGLTGDYQPSAFVLHGSPGFGHAYLTDHLLQLLENEIDETPVSIRLSLGAAWQVDTIDTLIEAIASNLSDDTNLPESPELLAALISDHLERHAVIVTIERIQRISGGLQTLIDNFWKPLNEGLPVESPHIFLTLLTLESTEEIDTILLNQSEDFDISEFDSALPIALPKLGKFDHDDLMRWFRKIRLSKSQAKNEATALLAETDGNPPQVYVQLMSHN